MNIFFTIWLAPNSPFKYTICFENSQKNLNRQNRVQNSLPILSRAKLYKVYSNAFYVDNGFYVRFSKVRLSKEYAKYKKILFVSFSIVRAHTTNCDKINMMIILYNNNICKKKKPWWNNRNVSRDASARNGQYVHRCGTFRFRCFNRTSQTNISKDT